jgi:hypothetical protein
MFLAIFLQGSRAGENLYLHCSWARPVPPVWGWICSTEKPCFLQRRKQVCHMKLDEWLTFLKYQNRTWVDAVTRKDISRIPVRLSHILFSQLQKNAFLAISITCLSLAECKSYYSFNHVCLVHSLEMKILKQESMS